MTAIRVEGLGKRFRQYTDRGSMLARLTGRGGGREVQDIWALRDIDFEVERGGTLGVIGRNGSGKTTLLRLLSGVSGPTEGRLRIEGHIASLIGIGVGFNRELTGRENVLVNGRLLGMTTAQVAGRFDRIVGFAELEEFIDLPVKFYSSGMFLRLAFAVAIHTDPDVLLIDEILAVGDVGFQVRCFERMRELRERGTTIVVVTHNLQILQRLTGRTMVLDHGRVRFDGATEQALAIYHEVLQATPEGSGLPASGSPGDIAYTGRASLDVTLERGDGTATSQVRLREPMAIRVEASFTDTVVDPIVSVVIERPGIGLLFAVASTPRGSDHVYGPDRPLTARLHVDDVPLLPATYSVLVQLRSAGDSQVHGMVPATLFHVTGERPGAGTVDFGPRMQVDGEWVEVARARLTP